MVKWVSGFWGARPGLRCAAAPARLWGSAASCNSDAAAADGGTQARSTQASYVILLLTQLACFLRQQSVHFLSRSACHAGMSVAE